MKSSLKKVLLAGLVGGMTQNALVLLIMILAPFAFPVSAEEPKAYTDEDLDKYNTYSTYDEETIRQSEANLKRWEKERESREKLESKKIQAVDKRTIQQKQTSIQKSVDTEKSIEDPDNKNAKTVKKRKT